MLKRQCLLLLPLAIAATAASCIFDPVAPGDKPPPPAQKYEDLTERWHVLNNLELAYNQRKISRYDEVLDQDFTFFLSTGDVGGGLPDSWDRQTEMNANTNLFTKDPPPPAPIPRCKSIKMDVQWEKPNTVEPNLAWVEVSPPGLSETWYTTTVFYDFAIDVEPDVTYISNPGSKAQFTVRNAGTADDPHWQLVEFRDLGVPE
jgi:hypothetical protein